MTIYRDFVRETSTTTGTGAFALAGAVTGAQSFSVIGSGGVCRYAVRAVDAGGNPTGQWEVGTATYTAGSLSRSASLIEDGSSGPGVLVNFTAGTKTVDLVQSAADVTTPVTDLSNIPGWSPLNRLAKTSTRCIVTVDQTLPSSGGSVTLASITGAGTLAMVQFTLGAGALNENMRVQVFTDGNSTPDVDCDVGTLCLIALDAKNTAQSLGTAHMITSIANSNTWSGGFLYPAPFANGCIVKLYNPPGSSGSGQYFSQIVYHPGVTSSLRLKSTCVTNFNKQSYGRTDQIVMMSQSNIKGSLVWLSYAATGTGGSSQPYGYLERQWYVAVDGESTTPDGLGAINPSFATSGGEDLFLNGWYYSGLQRISNPWVMVTAANNSNNTSVAGVDLLGLYGGIAFNNAIKVGWSLKDGPSGGAFLSNLTFAYSLLYYVDTSATFAPTAPTAPQAVNSSAGSGTGTVTWTAPNYNGNSTITGYTVTLSPGGASQTVSGTTLTATFTGLTNGTAYTPTVFATNAIGNSASAAGSAFTPATASVPGAPTSVSASAGNATASVGFTAPSSNGGSAITGYTATSTPGGFTGTVSGASASPITVSGLTNGTAYTFTVHATNGVGNSAESTASAAVTPAALAVSDNFNRSDAATLGTTQTGQTWTVVASTTGTSPQGNIASNAAFLSSASATAMVAYVSVGKADVDITGVYATFGSVTGYAGLAARVVDALNNVHLQSNSATTPTAYVLEQVVGGSYTTLLTASVTPTAGDTIRMKIVGTTIDVYINGTHYGPVTASGISTTSQNVGFQQSTASGASTARLDSFSVA